jgi:hypothetical protein
VLPSREFREVVGLVHDKRGREFRQQISPGSSSECITLNAAAYGYGTRGARAECCATPGRGSLNYVKGCCCCGPNDLLCLCARSLSDCQFPYTRWLSIVRRAVAPAKRACTPLELFCSRYATAAAGLRKKYSNFSRGESGVINAHLAV